MLCPQAHNKWNLIEHRLFSAISNNWQGRPLDRFETILNYIRTTVTETGLRVRAVRVTQPYAKGTKICPQQMQQLNLVKAQKLPAWNYEIHPQPVAETPSQDPVTDRPIAA